MRESPGRQSASALVILWHAQHRESRVQCDIILCILLGEQYCYGELYFKRGVPLS